MSDVKAAADVKADVISTGGVDNDTNVRRFLETLLDSDNGKAALADAIETVLGKRLVPVKPEPVEPEITEEQSLANAAKYAAEQQRLRIDGAKKHDSSEAQKAADTRTQQILMKLERPHLPQNERNEAILELTRKYAFQGPIPNPEQDRINRLLEKGRAEVAARVKEEADQQLKRQQWNNFWFHASREDNRLQQFAKYADPSYEAPRERYVPDVSFRYKGTVTMVNVEEHYGFIRSEYNDRELFFGFREVVENRIPVKGDEAEFALKFDKATDKPCAGNVVLLPVGR